MKTLTKAMCLVAGGAAFAVPAFADEPLPSEVGISTVIGAGVSGFTDESMRNVITNDVAGAWNLRVTVGSHSPLAVDLAYVGTAAEINALTGTQTGTLIGTTTEGALRYNILAKEAWNPYLFAGVGWQRYDVSGGNFSLSDTGINEYDNSVVFPMGGGLSYRDFNGLVVDIKGLFRANANYGLVPEATGINDYVPMHSWEASAAVGYEF